MEKQKKYVSINSIDQAIYTPRLAKPLFSYNDIIPYGNFDNLYPQKVISVAQKSWALSTALATFQDFIIGDGFGDVELDSLVINDRGQTLFDLLGFIADNKNKFGFAIHVNYNALGQITELQSLDFEDLRYNKEGKLVYNPDWANRYNIMNHKKEVVYELFNPEKAVEQAKEVGFENYTGQVFYWTGCNKIYPLSTFDSALESGQYQADQELFKLRNIQNGFALSGTFVYPKNIENADEKSDFVEMIQSGGIGANNTGRIWTMGVQPGIEGVDKLTQFIPFERANVDGLFTNQNKESREAIFSVFRQPAILNAISETGMFNQQSLQDAFIFYNSIVEKDRKEIEKALNMLMGYGIWGDMGLEIKPKMLIDAVEVEEGSSGAENMEGGE